MSEPIDARVSQPTPKKPYWEKYRWLRRWCFIVWITYIPVGFYIAFPLTRFLHSDAPAYLICGTWMVAFIALGMRMAWFLCPRCGKRFFFRGRGVVGFHNPLARRCLNCGLPKWEECEKREESHENQ
jgi:predicted RNA-binding Zn-ribbon protein involved in translation (DUF1610 family)